MEWDCLQWERPPSFACLQCMVGAPPPPPPPSLAVHGSRSASSLAASHAFAWPPPPLQTADLKKENTQTKPTWMQELQEYHTVPLNIDRAKRNKWEVSNTRRKNEQFATDKKVLNISPVRPKRYFLCYSVVGDGAGWDIQSPSWMAWVGGWEAAVMQFLTAQMALLVHCKAVVILCGCKFCNGKPPNPRRIQSSKNWRNK